MSTVFLKILNISLVASWLILAVIILRLFLRKAPKWISCLLWALVAVRLLLPFSVESVLSLVPSSEVIPTNIVYEQKPVIDSGIRVVNNTVNPVITETFAPAVGDSANPFANHRTGCIHCLDCRYCGHAVLCRNQLLIVKEKGSRLYSV